MLVSEGPCLFLRLSWLLPLQQGSHWVAIHLALNGLSHLTVIKLQQQKGMHQQRRVLLALFSTLCLDQLLCQLLQQLQRQLLIRA